MDTTTNIMMNILNDLYAGESDEMTAEYQKYYESLDASQSRIVVTGAINKILNENKGSTCDFGESEFKLKVVNG